MTDDPPSPCGLPTSSRLQRDYDGTGWRGKQRTEDRKQTTETRSLMINFAEIRGQGGENKGQR
jgi:hypothetical protein